jgi:hypothetical protein
VIFQLQYQDQRIMVPVVRNANWLLEVLKLI